MRLVFVVQRYGPEVAGGAEAHCRAFATRLAARGHDVAVLTSCASSYTDWSDTHPAGTSELDGVEVHRLAVEHPRDAPRFAALGERVLLGRDPAPASLARTWMRVQGPWLVGFGERLAALARSADVVVFFTYLYATAWAGVAVAAGRAPVVLHPTAHDEPPLRLALHERTFRLADALAVSTPEEADLVVRRFRPRSPVEVIGIGFDLPPTPEPGALGAAAGRLGLACRPYLACVGRVDPAKGVPELAGYFAAYKARNPGPLALVLVGDPAHPVAPHPDVTLSGVVDEPTKQALVAGSVAAVVPSYFESFSMVLAEAWALGRPALVQGRSPVLAGQARRSGGAVAYEGFARFEAAVERMVADPALGGRLGAAGRDYVERHYAWATVLDRYEALLERVRSRVGARR